MKFNKKILNIIKSRITHFYRFLLKAEIQLLAPSIAFMSVLSMVPFLAVSLVTFQFFGGPDRFLNFIEPKILDFFKIQGLKFDLGQWQPILEKILTENLTTKLVTFLSDILKNLDVSSIGWTGFVSLLLTSTKLFMDIDHAFQKIWQIKRSPSFTKRFLFYLSLVVFGPVLLSLIFGFISSGEWGLSYILPEVVFNYLPLLVAFLFLAFIYKMIPFARTDWKPSFLSAFLVTLFLSLAKTLYFYSMKNLMFYNKVYGSLASVPLFLIWVLLIWLIILSGAALNYAFHKPNELKVLYIYSFGDQF